jgi:hypothetical protein
VGAIRGRQTSDPPSSSATSLQPAKGVGAADPYCRSCGRCPAEEKIVIFAKAANGIRWIQPQAIQPFTAIKSDSSCKTLTLLESLDFQLKGLEEKRKLIDSAMRAIELATNAIRSGHATDASVLKKILEIIDMQPQQDFMRKYYAEQAWLDKAKLTNETPAEVREERSRSWKSLFAELEAALDLNPASEAAQALTERWLLLADAAAGGNDGIRDGGIKAWKDHENWPLLQQDALLNAYGLDLRDRTASMHRVERVANFIGRAISHRFQSNWRSLYRPK